MSAIDWEAKCRELAAAVLAYDAAIRNCANDPARMTSDCTAEGDDLDALYMKWLALAQAVRP